MGTATRAGHGRLAYPRVASVGSGLALAVIILAACSTGSVRGSDPPLVAAASNAGTTSTPSLAPPRVTPSPNGTSSAPPTGPPPVKLAVHAEALITAVPASEWALIVSTGAWHPGCPATQQTLRRVEVNFHGFDGAVHRGVLVVNADVAGDIARIFTALFDRGYPIHRMVPIEAYHGDDNASMAADNTSAYNCRRASQANASPSASPHANGRAVDVNPWENPWVDDRCGCFQPDAYYGTHRAGPAVIVKGGLVWTVFTAAGWIWQDNATIDYQHFDTGYPSVPR